MSAFSWAPPLLAPPSPPQQSHLLTSRFVISSICSSCWTYWRRSVHSYISVWCSPLWPFDLSHAHKHTHTLIGRPGQMRVDGVASQQQRSHWKLPVEWAGPFPPWAAVRSLFSSSLTPLVLLSLLLRLLSLLLLLLSLILLLFSLLLLLPAPTESQEPLI